MICGWNYLKFLLECSKLVILFLQNESRSASALLFRRLAWEDTREVEIELESSNGLRLKRWVISSRGWGYLVLLLLVVEEKQDFAKTIVGCFEENGRTFSLLSFSQRERIAIVNKSGAVVWDGEAMKRHIYDGGFWRGNDWGEIFNLFFWCFLGFDFNGGREADDSFFLNAFFFLFEFSFSLLKIEICSEIGKARIFCAPFIGT